MASAHLKSVCSKSLFSHCLPSNLQNLLFLYNFHVILFNYDNTGRFKIEGFEVETAGEKRFVAILANVQSLCLLG